MLRKNNVPLDLYNVTTKESLNYLSPMTKRVNKEKLFDMDVKQYGLRELMNRRFQYKFQEPLVEEVYNLAIFCKEYLNFKGTLGVEFIRNRYLHFFGYNQVLERYDTIYRKWIMEVDAFTYNIFESLLKDDEEYKTKLVKAKIMCDEFRGKYTGLNRHLESIRHRAAIELMRIDELIYNVI